jgi:hypothetical protein
MLSGDEGFALFRYFNCLQKPVNLPFKSEERVNPFMNSQQLLYDGDLDSYSITTHEYSSETITNTVMCNFSRSFKKTLLFHASDNNADYCSITLRVEIIQDEKTTFSYDERVSATKTHSSNACYEVCLSELIKAGNATIDISYKLYLPTTYRNDIKHTLKYGKADRSILLNDKYLTLCIEKIDRLPLFGIEYTLV